MIASMDERRFRVRGMDCANCAQTIESGIARLEGVDSCQVNFASETLTVLGEAPSEAVVARVQELGYEVQPLDHPSQPAPGAPEPPHGFWHYLGGRQDARLALLATLLLLPGLLFHELLPWLGVDHLLIDAASVVAALLAGYPVALRAWRSLRFGREVNINVLMTIAALGALVIGAYTEAAVVMVLFVLGEAMEGYTAERARSSIRGMMTLAPDQATRLVLADGYPRETRVAVDDLQVGDRILVRPGERIAMDGRILAGRSSVDQAAITGESLPVAKGVSDEVFAGSVNGEGALEIEVSRRARDNTISRLIRLVEEAQEKRAPAQRFIDRFARWYTPAVIGVALLVALVPTILFGQPALVAGAPTEGWLYRALAMLVVACPCALVISTPVTLVSAISNGARHGVLFKGGVHIESLARITAIAFDKTGTLTKGRPAVVAYRSVDCATDGQAPCDPCDDLLALASAVERRSQHPLAQAVEAEAAARSLVHRYPPADAVTNLPGRGVTGQVNGRQITVGSHGFFHDNSDHPPAHCRELGEADAQGQSTMLVSQGDEYRGYIAVADAVRESSRAVATELKALGLKELIMLTGDNQATAEAVAAQVGVTGVRANCLPEDKVDAVEALQAQHGPIAMVGDGINDAPALAAAAVGIAIGHTAQAMETADVTLMRDSLLPLPFAIRLSRAAMRAIKANVAASLLVKFVVFGLVLAGMGTMWMAVLADMGMSLLVTLNGMRLLRRPAMPGATAPN